MSPGKSRHEHQAFHYQQSVNLNIHTRKEEISNAHRTVHTQVMPTRTRSGTPPTPRQSPEVEPEPLER